MPGMLGRTAGLQRSHLTRVLTELKTMIYAAVPAGTAADSSLPRKEGRQTMEANNAQIDNLVSYWTAMLKKAAIISM